MSWPSEYAHSFEVSLEKNAFTTLEPLLDGVFGLQEGLWNRDENIVGTKKNRHHPCFAEEKRVIEDRMLQIRKELYGPMYESILPVQMRLHLSVDLDERAPAVVQVLRVSLEEFWGGWFTIKRLLLRLWMKAFVVSRHITTIFSSFDISIQVGKMDVSIRILLITTVGALPCSECRSADFCEALKMRAR